LLEIYGKLLLIRLFETNAVELYSSKTITGALHLYSGQEAVAVGACSCLREDDFITSTHRGHGHCIAKGCEPKFMIAELYGKKTGYCKGKGGSMHIANINKGMLGANGIVGGGLPLACGTALSAKVRGTDQVTLCFFGDGATNQGTFHEALNLASIWSLPVVFIVENNLYAEATHQSYHQKIVDIADRASSYSIPGEIVDGNDVIAVYCSVAAAVKRARGGEGPSLIECKTYRYLGHTVRDDDLRYRTVEEVEEWKKKDPINRFREKIIGMGVVSLKDIGDVERFVERTMREAVEFAEESPFPEPEEALEDVYFHLP
jgi:pyruvate dehydrogenase E1 component alpha subunit